MFETIYSFVGQEFLFNGGKVTAIAETDSGNVKVKLEDGSEVWTTDEKLVPWRFYQIGVAA